MGSKDIFQAMFEEATIGMLVVNTSGDIVEANSFIEKLFGYERGELHGKKLDILLPDTLRSVHAKHVEKYIKKPERRTMGNKLGLYGLHKNGSAFRLEVSLTYVENKGEQLVIAYVSDFSIKKHRLLDLKKAEAINKDISKIVEQSLNEIFIFDTVSLKFIQVNKGARTNMGYTLEELQHMTPIDIKPEHTESSFVQLIAPLINGEKEKIIFESTHQRKDKTIYPVEVHLQYYKIGDQPVFVSIILDISTTINAKKKLQNINIELEEKVKKRTKALIENEAKLEQALIKEKELNELKSRFVSMASHEFRTPLSSILSSSGLIGRYTDTDQQEHRMKHVNRIKSSVNNLTSILNDFLSLEKLESGKISCQLVAVNIRDFIAPILDEMKQLNKKNQQIIHQHSGKPIVKVDEHLTKNILLNLLSNAVKYSSEGQDVDLISEAKKESLVIKVRDHGIGIPPHDQQYMFNRFFRATNVTNIQGTGLGLTIVKRYLNLMNGTIYFESKENEGTTFIVEIPQ